MDQADKEAAELLPCSDSSCGYSCDAPNVYGEKCPTCIARPAVAERLANYCEQLRQRDEQLKQLEMLRRQQIQTLQERIAALEAFVARISRIGILDHDRAGVLQCDSCRADARMIREGLAALAGRKP